MSSWIEYAAKKMRSDFPELVARFFKDGSFEIQGICSVANRRNFVAGKVADIEKVQLVALFWYTKSPKKIVEQNETVEDNGND